MSHSPTFLCIASYFKGEDFLREIKSLGATVYFLTDKSLEHKPWPREAIDEFLMMEAEKQGVWNMKHLIKGLAHTMRTKKIDRIVALDDFDVEKAAELREHFRIPGMGQTTARHFRDKLAMRMKAKDEGITAPAFSPLFNNDEVHEYTQKVSAPWVVKPRGEASAVGIKKVHSAEQLWQVIEGLGDERDGYLIEQFTPGDVYHVDSVTVDGKVSFTQCSKYLTTPMEVSHGGGIFRSVNVDYGSQDEKDLLAINDKLLTSFGMRDGVSHSEFIKSRATGEFYFLETSSRVCGANLHHMVEATSGINLYREWARLEFALLAGQKFETTTTQPQHGGIVASLTRFQHPNYAIFNDPEICWKLQKDYHMGMIVRSENRERIFELLDQYAARIGNEFHASMPVKNNSYE